MKKLQQPTISKNGDRAHYLAPGGKGSGTDEIIANLGRHHHNILIGVPTLGMIRYEWHVHRRNQVLPINWQSGEVTASHQPNTVASIGYTTEDAQNICAYHALKQDYEWLFLWEDDVLPPFNVFILLEQCYVRLKKYPVVSGLYYSKSNPSWPLIFRGRGNGAFLDFNLGDRVWCDGVPTGFILIHMSVIKWFADHSETYTGPDGNKMKRIFKFPRDAWFDPEADAYFAQMGTSDLRFCDDCRTFKVFENLGWARKIPNMRYPFLCDTRLFCRQIDLKGIIYPDHVEALHPRGVKAGGRLPDGAFARLKPRKQKAGP